MLPCDDDAGEDDTREGRMAQARQYGRKDACDRAMRHVRVPLRSGLPRIGSRRTWFKSATCGAGAQRAGGEHT